MRERERECVCERESENRNGASSSKFTCTSLSVYPCSGQPGQRVRPTPDELIDPNGPYTKRRVDVTSDPVGYGFVIRGSRPVYVHTVDPSGPAAAAGLQVGGAKHITRACLCTIILLCSSLDVFIGMTTFTSGLCVFYSTSES